MSDIKVAIIDDGISLELNNRIKVKNFTIQNDILVLDTNLPKNILTHGTKCINVFEKYARNYELYSLKVLDTETRRTDIIKLEKCLEWCIKERMDLVSLSIGSTQMADFLVMQQVIKQMEIDEILIIAACDNDYQITIPASFDSVIGVKADKMDMLKDGKYIYDEVDIFNIQMTVGSLKHKFPELGLDNHNSYVTPYVAALVCNMLSEGIPRTDIVQHLKKGGENNKEKICKNFNYDLYRKYSSVSKSDSTQIQIYPVISKGRIEDIINIFVEHGYRIIAIVEKKDSECIFIFSYEDILNSVKIKVGICEKINMFLKLIAPDLVLWNIPIRCVDDATVDFMDGIIDIKDMIQDSQDFCTLLFNYIINNY